MGFPAWFSENAFNLIGVVGVICSLCFTAFSLRSETKTRRISNLLVVTANHREVWNTFLTHKELARVRDAMANPVTQPVTDSERIFVNMVIQHLNSVYRAMNDQLFVKLEGWRRDVAEFFSLPIPSDVWEKVKATQNDDFVAFVDGCHNWK